MNEDEEEKKKLEESALLTTTTPQERTTTPNENENTPTTTQMGQDGVDYSLGWDAFHKANPNVGSAAYLTQNAKYRKDNGLEPYSWAETVPIIRSQYDEEQQKADKAYTRSQTVTNIGDFIAGLVNYARAKNGHTAYQIDLDSQRNRLDALRTQGMQQRRQHMQDMLNVWRQNIQDARQREQEERSQKNWEAQMQYTKGRDAVKDRQWEITNNLAVANAERAAEQFKKTYDETVRAHKANEATARLTALNKGNGTGKGSGVKESIITHDGSTFVRPNTLSANEARGIILQWGTPKQIEKMKSNSYYDKPDIVGIASEVLRTANIDDAYLTGMGFVKTVQGKGQAERTPFTLSEDGEEIPIEGATGLSFK